MADRPRLFKNCPVCGAETPKGAINCPNCGVDLEIARSNAGEQRLAPPPSIKKSITVGTIVGWVMGLFLLLLLYGFIHDTMLLPAMYAPTPRPTPRPTITHNVQTSIMLTGYAPSTCTHWSEISARMNGQTVCVYGTIYQITTSRETFTRIEFTDQPNTFFLYSVDWYFYDKDTGKNIAAGDCLSFTGKVATITGVPYISMGHDLPYFCEPWMTTRNPHPHALRHLVQSLP